jgi:DNA-binding phage protein
MPSSAPDPLFLKRLRHCTIIAGSIRALAKQTTIGEAHMYRYLSGDIDPPLGRVRLIAEACKVDLGWLVTGYGEPLGKQAKPRPFRDPAIE